MKKIINTLSTILCAVFVGAVISVFVTFVVNWIASGAIPLDTDQRENNPEWTFSSFMSGIQFMWTALILTVIITLRLLYLHYKKNNEKTKMSI